MNFANTKKLMVLLLFWCILSGYWEPFFLMLGVFSSIIACLVSNIVSRKLGSIDEFFFSSRSASALLLNFCYYSFWLICKSFFSALYVMKRVWQVRININPTFKLVKTSQKTDLSTFLLANSITFTPGTVSVDILSVDNSIRISALNDDLTDVKDIDDQVKKLFI